MPNQDPSTVILEWQSPDTITRKRGSKWYLIGGVFVLMFAAYGLVQGSWTTTVLALLIGGIYFLMRNTKPRILNIRITGMGISIEGELHQWNTLRDFWILIGQDHQELHLVRQGALGRELIIYLQSIDPSLVRETLLGFLPERSGMEERFFETIARILKL